MESDRKILARLVRHIQSAPEDPFTPLIDEYMIKRARKGTKRSKVLVDLTPRHRPGKRLSPSVIGGCERAASFSFVGIRGAKKIDPKTELIFDNGDWVHRKFQAMFEDMERVLGRDRIRVLGIEERIMYPELYITGYLDIAVKIKVNGKWVKVVIDIKSINARGFAQLEASHEPVESHTRQVTTYGVARGKFDYLCVMYENKDTNELLPLMFKYDPIVWEQVKAWCERVLSALENEKLPPKHPNCREGNFDYEKCPHREICYGSMPKPAIRVWMYQDFPGIDAAWQAGLAEEEALADA